MMLRRAALAAALLPCAASFSSPWQASPWHLSRGASAACSRWSALPLRMHSPATSVAADRRVVRGVLLEALEQQQCKKEALQDQLDKVQQAAPAALSADDADDEDVRKRLAKAARRAEQVPQHLAAVAAVEAKLEDLLAGLGSGPADAALLAELDAMGLGPRLATFDVHKASRKQWGRPDGFGGLVLESPRGIPILVAPRSFNDELLRRVGRGKDLFFQVCARGARETPSVPNPHASRDECARETQTCARACARTPTPTDSLFMHR